jgi:hypothetical protein
VLSTAVSNDTVGSWILAPSMPVWSSPCVAIIVQWYSSRLRILSPFVLTKTIRR